jgi:hypothetical protein
MKEIVDRLIEEHLPFVVPVLIDRDDQLQSDDLGIASGCLINTGQREVLVTCFHVWEHFVKCNGAKRAALVVGLGVGAGAAIRIRQPELIDSSPESELDLAILNFPASMGLLGGQKHYPLHLRGTKSPVVGQAVSVIGFPRIWRSSLRALGYAPIPFIVSDVNARGFIASESGENAPVFKDLDREAPPLRLDDSLRGLSGAPAFFGEDGSFTLAGFVKHRGCGALFFSSASNLKRDGTIIKP